MYVVTVWGCFLAAREKLGGDVGVAEVGGCFCKVGPKNPVISRVKKLYL